MNKVRVDKWLWAVRIYKSRSMAGNACKAGRVKINDQSVKASYMLTVGEVLVVRRGPIRYRYKVLGLIDKRMSAKLVADKYEDITPAEEKINNKMGSAFIIPMGNRKRGAGRPTKKERRDIERLNEEFDDDIEDAEIIKDND